MGIVISGVILRATIVITHSKGLLILLITTHEPPSMELNYIPIVLRNP